MHWYYWPIGYLVLTIACMRLMLATGVFKREEPAKLFVGGLLWPLVILHMVYRAIAWLGGAK